MTEPLTIAPDGRRVAVVGDSQATIYVVRCFALAGVSKARPPLLNATREAGSSSR
jgi:hypothetical protein